MSPKQAKRLKDGAVLLALLAVHIVDPYELEYTEDLAGSLDTGTLVKWAGLMQGVRAMNASGSLVQAAVAAALYSLAESNEAVWHLAGEAKAWSESRARMVRAMCRHVQQAYVKIKKQGTPVWLKKVLGAEISTAAETPEEGDDANDTDLEEVEEEEPEEEEEDRYEFTAPDAAPPKLTLLEDSYEFGYDESLQAQLHLAYNLV